LVQRDRSSDTTEERHVEEPGPGPGLGIDSSLAHDPPGAPRRRWRPLALAIVLVLVAGGIAVGVLAGHATQGPSASRVVRPLTRAQITERDRAERAILHRRSLAVMRHDRSAWLADVDRSDPGFLAEQKQVWANLSQLTFSSWSYQPIGRDYNRPDLASTYAGHYHLPAVLLHYAIKGYDMGPVARPEVLTFVLRGHRWLLASDTDGDRDLPPTGHGDPWDRRPMVTGRGKHVLVLADAADRDQLPDLVRVADASVARVADMWRTGWRRKVVVVAVRDQQLIETYFRTDLQSSENVAAIAVPAYDFVPGWSTSAGSAPAKTRSRVIINPRYFDPTDAFNRILLTHEVTHVATQGATFRGAPTWLVEGAAQYTAYRSQGGLGAVRLTPGLRKEAATGSVTLPTYDFYQGDVSGHYVTGWLACALIARDYGEPKLREVYARLGRTPNEAFTIAAQERVFHRLLGTSEATFERRLAAYVEQVGR
jgi:hypothetical protein